MLAPETPEVVTWAAWVGRTSSSTALLHNDQANRMAVTLDRTPTFSAGDDLPPAWHWLYFHELVPRSGLGQDGHPATGHSVPPLPDKRRMWASGSLRFLAPLRLGDVATRVSRIADIASKQGRSGGLVFVTLEHDVSVSGRLALQESQVLVYRDPAGESRPGAPEGTADGTAGVEVARQRTWNLDSTTLFRYSALTFNSHRIHYDADYARDVEGYPGLVVQGPLLATLLADTAADDTDQLAGLDYRARSPLFASESFTVRCHRVGDEATVQAAAENGRLAMEATATYTRRTDR